MSRSTKIFGDKLLAAREKAHLTQIELGLKVGVTDENIGRIERSPEGKEGIMSKRLPKLAEALGMSIDELYRNLVVPQQGGAGEIDLLWGRLFAAAQAVAAATKKTRLQILTEAVRRESMPSKMKLVAKPLGPRGPQP